MTTPQHKNPCSRGNYIKFYNFGRLFLGHHYHPLSLSDLCLSEQKKFLKKIIHGHYTTYMATTQQNKPCPGGHEIYDFGGPFLDIITIPSVCLISAWE